MKKKDRANKTSKQSQKPNSRRNGEAICPFCNQLYPEKKHKEHIKECSKAWDPRF